MTPLTIRADTPRAVVDAIERVRSDAANSMFHSSTDDLSTRLMCRVGIRELALVLAWLDQHTSATIEPKEPTNG